MTTKPFSVWHLLGINYSSNNKFLLESNQNIKCLSATTGVTTISKIFIRQVGQKFQNLDLTQDPTMKTAHQGASSEGDADGMLTLLATWRYGKEHEIKNPMTWPLSYKSGNLKFKNRIFEF